MKKEKTVLNLVQGREPVVMINARIPISLHDKVHGQILVDRANGNRHAGWTEIIINALVAYSNTPEKKRKAKFEKSIQANK